MQEETWLEVWLLQEEMQTIHIEVMVQILEQEEMQTVEKEDETMEIIHHKE